MLAECEKCGARMEIAYLTEHQEEDCSRKKPESVSFLVPHLIGNPVDAIDTFIQLAKKQIQNGKHAEALEILNEADKSVEEAKSRINDFRNGKYK